MNGQKKNVKMPLKKKVARVPVVMQLEALECGAACLTMILAYYNKWIPLEQVRKDCGVSRDGSNALNILLAARSYGLEADAYKAEPDILKKEGSFPCIIHWEFNHFIVLDGFRGGKVYLNDPARGRVVLSEEEFDRGFTGVFLLFEPSENFAASGQRKSTLEFARKRLKGAAPAVVFIILISVISAAFGLINPSLDRIFFDRLIIGRNASWILPFLGIMCSLALLQLTVSWIRAIYSLRLQAKMAVIGNMTYMWKLLRLPIDFFSQRMAGDLLQRQSTNATITDTLVNTFAPLLLDSVMMIVYLVFMVHQSPILTLIGVSCMSINLLNSMVMSRKRVNITRVQQRDSGKLASMTMTGIKMIETIKASGSENGYFKNWAGLQASVNYQSVQFERLNATLGLITPFFASFADILVTALGVYLTMQKRFTIGMLFMFQRHINI